jgi:hypothetical protein
MGLHETCTPIDGVKSCSWRRVHDGCFAVILQLVSLIYKNGDKIRTIALDHSFIIKGVNGNESPVPPGVLSMYV